MVRRALYVLALREVWSKTFRLPACLTVICRKDMIARYEFD